MQRLVMPFDDLAMISQCSDYGTVHGSYFGAPAICGRLEEHSPRYCASIAYSLLQLFV
jgi:hypothetical protein